MRCVAPGAHIFPRVDTRRSKGGHPTSTVGVMNRFAAQRRQMVERQVAARGVHDPWVLAAMREVPREMFVGDAMREYAYEDSPLPIDVQQTISQRYIVALMIEAAEVGPGDCVLEIGAGSGYAAAVMGRIAGQVFAIERHGQLARLAR